MDHASLLAEVVHCYLPKWCTLIYRSGALLFTDFGALLFTDHRALIWLMVDPGWEPLVTSIGLVAALIAEIYGGGNGGINKMTQKGGKNSKNFQSGGDMTIN